MTTKRKVRARAQLMGKARLRADISEIAQDAADCGAMSRDGANKITMRMLGPDALPGAGTLKPAEIVSIRQRENMSQAVFARLLAVTTSTLSKWERGEVAPSGPARRLLMIIKAQGTDAFLKPGR